MSETRFGATTDFSAHVTTLALPADWRHLRLEATIDPPRLRLTADEPVATVHLDTAWLYPPAAMASTRIGFGAFASVTGSWDLNLDDVAVYIE